jgi:DNA-directed RNA polymerase subunit RPC12/RpoP
MELRATIRTGMSFTIVFAILAVGLLVSTSGVLMFDFDVIRLTGGIVFAIFTVAAALGTARAKVAYNEMERKLAKYGCQKCGYHAHPNEITDKLAGTCPECGTRIYK